MKRLARQIRFAIALLSVGTATFGLAAPKLIAVLAADAPTTAGMLTAVVDSQDLQVRRPPRLPRSKPEHWKS